MNRTATLAALAALSFAAQAEGVTFNTPVTYTQPVTYAAGVTYLAPVTYSQSAQAGAQLRAAAEPVVLERVIVTPTRTYAESEWRALRLARAEKQAPSRAARYMQVRSEAQPSTISLHRWLRALVQ
ncbi:MAG: hypothetical protein EPN60_08035 [Nevskiaceae bacterium]|nr:MAG: hypothetical protein EPO48_06855 [Nevskiaceae bacterium]TAM27472.1 MAG: hypothetical protein EPN60_08035 [Nevskiaceae bacterium]